MDAPTRVHVEAALARCGLRLRGGWIPGPDDALPLLPHGHTAAVVWMVGMAGSECWPAFSASTFFTDGQPHSLDRWAASIGDALARRWAGVALYPSDGPPYYPFQQWGSRAENLQPSPLMLQMHPEYGLWHAYRFALALPDLQAGDLGTPTVAPHRARSDICLQCDGQPCLQACPVQAFSGQAFAADSCQGHLQTPQGQDCMQGGCRARLACPQGQAYVYHAAHAAFHMQAFKRSARLNLSKNGC
jgi:hypothetical protein